MGWNKSSKELGKGFLDTLGNIFHVNFLGYAHWFMFIIISQLKDHSIPVDQASYDTSVVSKYPDTAKIKNIQSFKKLPYLML